MTTGKRAQAQSATAPTPAGLAELYAQYLPRVYAYVAYRVNRTEDVEDVVAEAFLRVVRNWRRFETRHAGAFGAWLFEIAHSLVVDFHRRANARPAITPLEEIPEQRAATPLPEEAALQAETAAGLRRLIARLPARQQEVITLKFFGQLRNREIAAILELDERTVAAHLCRGLRELQRRFRAEHQTREGGEHR